MATTFSTATGYTLTQAFFAPTSNTTTAVYFFPFVQYQRPAWGAPRKAPHLANVVNPYAVDPDARHLPRIRHELEAPWKGHR